MCGRYGRRADKQRITEWFHTHNTDVFNDEYYEINNTRLAPSYNIAPESIQPVVRLDRDTGERVLALMKWGLVPYWSKTPKANFSSINARSDKLESSGAWREPWKHRRCLIPANFFFEWEPLTKEEEKKKLSKPWAVSLADDGLFAFGGIWDRWKGLDEKKSEIVVESLVSSPQIRTKFWSPSTTVVRSSSNRSIMSDGSRRSNRRIFRSISFEHIPRTG
jgi:putative SOS response-associated peptidase YedK